MPADAALVSHDRSRIDPDTHQAKDASTNMACTAHSPLIRRASHSTAPKPWHI